MDTKQELINQAKHFFSSKGFHQTSVQEIARGAGISKGAFYKHFDSKESLFVELLKRYQQDLNAAIAPPYFAHAADKKQAFTENIILEIDKTIADKNFFQMIFKDFPKDDSGEMQSMLEELRAAQVVTTKNMLLEVYGEATKPFIADLAALYDGMKREFFIYMIFENYQVDVRKLAQFIVSSMDAIVQNLEFMQPVLSTAPAEHTALEKTFVALNEKLRSLPAHSEKQLASLRLLEEEVDKSERQDFLVEALIVYLAQEPLLQPELSKLQALL